MYLHIGNGVVAAEKDILGLFDLDNLTSSEEGAAFLRAAEKEGILENIGGDFDLPKSVIVTSGGGKTRAFLSPVTTLTLLKRNRETGDDIF